MTLWLLTPNQSAHKLTDDSFRPAFYVHAQEPALQRIAQLLPRKFRVDCRQVERRDVWQAKPIRTLEVAVHNPMLLRSVVYFVQKVDSEVRLYNSDLMLASLYCWERSLFPLAHVEVDVNENGRILGLDCVDDPWALDYEIPPFRIMEMRLAGLSRVNPAHGRRGALEIEMDGEIHSLDDSDIPVVENFAHLLKRYDPDLLLTDWGDSLVLPYLRQQAKRAGMKLPLNRDSLPVQQSRGRSYMSYGRVLFKESATTLFGRLHVDSSNSFMAEKCELAGLWEFARVTKLPVQYATRTTAGTGISYMQMELAWRDDFLIPAQKAEPEDLKTPDELLCADRGGLVFTPKIGFFENAAELDFVSEYPSIMAKFNISPETVNCPCCPETPRVPELGYRVCQRRRGITSRVVERLITKRVAWKHLQREADGEDAQRYKRRRDSLKWLLVCCFGYTGYKNARFGKIEAHEAINAIAREVLLVAKEIAESRGYELLHALVDSMYVRKPSATPEDYERLAKEIEGRTGLPIAVEAVYRYVVFLPSKQFDGIPVPNRFFAAGGPDGLKVRGLDLRRHDTAPLVTKMQRKVLEILSEAHDYETYCRKLEDAQRVLDRCLERVKEGSVAIEELVISKRITKPPSEYEKASVVAIAAQQLHGRGVRLRPGQTVEYVITDAGNRVPNDRVCAYALWDGWRGYDRKKYLGMLHEAFDVFLKPTPHSSARS